MSKEREVVEVKVPVTEPPTESEKIVGASDEVIANLAANPPVIPVNETKEQRKARLVNVLSRGVIADVLNVPLPEGVKGEWVRADAMQVRAMQMLGFQIDNQYAVKRSIHNDGTSSARVADVIFMTTTAENYDTIHEIRNEQRMQSEYRGKRAEHEFQSGTERETGGEIKTFNESKSEKLAIPLSAIERQTQS